MIRHLKLALAFGSIVAASQTAAGENKFVQHNLVSDLPQLADHVDPKLQSPWGIALSGTSPSWIVDNHTGLATICDRAGTPAPLEVPVPVAAGSGTSSPTGQVFNPTHSFAVPGGKPALFLFATEDGTISGWYGGIANNKAVVLTDRSDTGAIYKGLALVNPDSGPVLYAANFHAGAIEVFGGAFAPKTLPGSFSDPSLPPGFAPFNVFVSGGDIFVAYAKQDQGQGGRCAGTRQWIHRCLRS